MKINKLEADFRLLEAAAVAGKRCPFTQPFGPIGSDSIPTLVAGRRIRSEVYHHNYRVVTILDGPHKGKATAPPPNGGSPYLVNGVHVDRLSRRHT